VPYWARAGARLFYERHGRGRPPLVFVHGNGCAHEDWDRQVDFFQGRHEVVTPDLRGHGASADAPGPYDIETLGDDLVGLLALLNLPPAVLIGHSMACRVVLQAHLVAPGRVAGLVLVDGSRMGQGAPAAVEAEIRQEIARVGFGQMLRGFFVAHFLDSSDPALRDRIIRRAATLPERVGAELLPNFIGWDARVMDRALAEIAVPLLVIQSTYINTDRVRVPIEPGMTTPWLELVRRHVPGARIEVVPGVGHFTMIEAPERVNELLATFLAGLPPAVTA
jgi:pimeloyl-ACP methyl ester carboxylesterase